MTVHRGTVRVRTTEHEQTRDITEKVADVVRGSHVREGICVVSSAHTTAGIFVNENADPAVQHDLVRRLRRIVPDDDEDRHAEGNTPAHVKAVIVGSDVTVPVQEGVLALGHWQGIFFAEFDGPRDRTATVTVIGEAAD